MIGCSSAHGKSCAYWKPLSGNPASSNRACHYCLEVGHSRATDEDGNCLSFVAGSANRKVAHLSTTDWRKRIYIDHGRRPDHRIKAVKK